MPMFITLGNFTDQGIRSYQDSPKRAQAFMELVESMGGMVHNVYWTLGQYDLVAIVEAPDDETAAAIAVKQSSLGNVRGMTMRAFGKDDIAKVIKAAG
ncbi:MAG: GYD domain-containing protein [Acidimicrobiia bacterium]